MYFCRAQRFLYILLAVSLFPMLTYAVHAPYHIAVGRIGEEDSQKELGLAILGTGLGIISIIDWYIRITLTKLCLFSCTCHSILHLKNNILNSLDLRMFYILKNSGFQLKSWRCIPTFLIFVRFVLSIEMCFGTLDRIFLQF